MSMLQRLMVAVLIAAGIYGISVGVGSLLYATGTIATGATHNNCDDFRKDLAEEQGIDEEDVRQSDIKRLAETCLASHELTENEAYRTEYLIWAAWPAVICALIFLAWPFWARILHNQEVADGVVHGGTSA